MKIKPIVLTAMVVCGFAASTTVVLANGVDVASKTVGFADLNLDSDKGAQVLLKRIESAARDVCSPFDGRDAVSLSARNNCVNSAVGSAVAHVDNNKVTALFSHVYKTTEPRKLVASR
jgi:UrcA family protein